MVNLTDTQVFKRSLPVGNVNFLHSVADPAHVTTSLLILWTKKNKTHLSLCTQWRHGTAKIQLLIVKLGKSSTFWSI